MLVLSGGLEEERMGSRGTSEASAGIGIGTGDSACFFRWRKGMCKSELECPLLRLSDSDPGPTFLVSRWRTRERTGGRWVRRCVVERPHFPLIHNVIILGGAGVADNLDVAFSKGVGLCDDIGRHVGVITEERVWGWGWNWDGVVGTEGPAGT